MEKFPYYFVAFYKFRDQCFRVHLTEDCKNTSCKRKGSPKKHIKQCWFGGNCQRNNKDKSCEFSHYGLESNIERITKQLWESEDLVLKLKQEIIQLQKTNKEKSILINDLECSIPQKLFDEETFYECRHCSKDSEDLIVKQKQEIIELQKTNKEKNILIDNLSFKVSDLFAEYQKPKKLIDEETLSCNRCSKNFKVNLF